MRFTDCIIVIRLTGTKKTKYNIAFRNFIMAPVSEFASRQIPDKSEKVAGLWFFKKNLKPQIDGHGVHALNGFHSKPLQVFPTM